MWPFRRRPVPALPPVAEDEHVRVLRPIERHTSPPAERVERYVAALAVHAHQLEDRLLRLEGKVEEQADLVLDLPTHSDLLEVQLHSARVAADVGKLALELRSEVAEIKEAADRAAAGHGAPPTEREKRLAALAQELLDLAAS